MAKATMLHRMLSCTNQASMGVSMIAKPEATRLLSEAFGYQFDAGSGVGDKDQVKMIRAGIEEA